MGCDIHFYAEKKVNGVWQSADTWEQDRYADEREDARLAVNQHFYDGRNYDLFAILANVRNGRGFAGVDTGDGFKPISGPKGLPSDISAEVQAESDRWDCDGHSHSWLTVSELLAYDWTQRTKLRAFVQAAEYWRWNRYDRRQGESPDETCGGIDGPKIRKVTEAEMKAILEPYGQEWSAADKIKKELDHVYCHCEWEQPYYRCCRNFLSDTMPRLWRLGSPDDVRIVFWFDN
jgi:hypothetical protein